MLFASQFAGQVRREVVDAFQPGRQARGAGSPHARQRRECRPSMSVWFLTLLMFGGLARPQTQTEAVRHSQPSARRLSVTPLPRFRRLEPENAKGRGYIRGARGSGIAQVPQGNEDLSSWLTLQSSACTAGRPKASSRCHRRRATCCGSSAASAPKCGPKRNASASDLRAAALDARRVAPLVATVFSVPRAVSTGPFVRPVGMRSLIALTPPVR